MTTGEKVATDVGAVAAVFSPFWLPTLQAVSEVAAMLVPILGAVWLTIQITYFLFRARKS